MDIQNTIKRCPVCGSNDYEQIFELYEGPVVTSDHGFLDKAILDNRCCRNCGFIYNAEGTRKFTAEFYKSSYRLMLKKAESEIQSFSDKLPIPQSERTFNILCEMVTIPEKGNIFEVGAGKGDFLKLFSNRYEKWDISAIEPSASAEILKQRFPSSDIIHSVYKGYKIEHDKYNLMVSLGVFEHVENPLDMFEWVRNGLKDNGILFIRVPNFERNPNDLLCADHLSKLTVDTLSNLAEAAGFEVIDVREAGVPVFIILKKIDFISRSLTNVFDHNISIARQNADLIKKMLDAIKRARNRAKEKEENFAIFGLASAGMFSPFYLNFDPADITAYVDENQSMWNSTVLGCPVGGLDLISKLNIKHVALSISPVYFETIIRKLESLGVSIYAPK